MRDLHRPVDSLVTGGRRDVLYDGTDPVVHRDPKIGDTPFDAIRTVSPGA